MKELKPIKFNNNFKVNITKNEDNTTRIANIMHILGHKTVEVFSEDGPQEILITHYDTGILVDAKFFRKDSEVDFVTFYNNLGSDIWGKQFTTPNGKEKDFGIKVLDRGIYEEFVDGGEMCRLTKYDHTYFESNNREALKRLLSSQKPQDRQQ